MVIDKDISWLMSPLGLQSKAMRDFQRAKHIEFIARKSLDIILERIPGKDILAVSLPPRHGKSTFLCVYLPSWFLLTHPHKHVILLSYSNALAEDFGRQIRDTINTWGKHIGIQLNKRSHAAHRFHIHQHGGGFTAASIYGSYTGKGAHLLLVDDAVKELSDVLSVTRRNRCFETFRACALSRLEPGGKVILIMTRWSNEDLIGQILSDPGLSKRVEYIRIPAIAEEDDILGRQPGDPLWPERYDLDSLKKIAESMGGIQGVWFQSLYQQNPPVAGKYGMMASLAKENWPKRIITTHQQNYSQVIRYWDIASTGGDYTASIQLSIDQSLHIAIITDMTIFRSTSTEDIIQHIRQTISKDDNSVLQAIEQVGTSDYIVSLMKETMPGKQIIGDKTGVGSKIERLAYAVQLITQNRLFISRSTIERCAEAWSEFITECHTVSNGESPKHDDMIDALSGACKVAINYFSALLLNNPPAVPEITDISKRVAKPPESTRQTHRISWKEALTWPTEKLPVRYALRPE